MSARVLARGLAVIALLVIAGYLVKNFGLGGMFDEDWIDTHVRSNGFAGDVLFIAAASLFVTVGFPRQVVSFLAGYAFGLGFGFVHALAASGIGCVVAFSVARYLARDLVAQRLPQRFKRVDVFLSDNTFLATLLIRFMPLGNNLATNLAAGLSQARAVHFVSASVLGYVPQTLVFALLGSGITLNPELRISLAVVLFVLSSVLGAYLFRKYRRAASDRPDDHLSSV